MVSLQEAETQLKAQQQQIEKARAAAEAARLKFTQQQLRNVPVQQRQQAEQSFQQQKAGVLERLKSQKQEIEEAQEQVEQRQEQQQKISEAQKEIQAYEQAQKLFAKKVRLSAARGTPVYKYLRDLYQREDIKAQQYEEYQKDLAKFKAEFPEEQLKFDSAGNVVGVESEYLDKSIPLPSYEEEIKKLQPPSTDMQGREIGESRYTGGKGVVSLPEKGSEEYLRQVAQKGVLSGTIFYAGEKAKSFITERELKQEKPYQPYATGRLAQGVVSVAPYVNPAGAALLVGSGVEQVAIGSMEYQGIPSERRQQAIEFEKKGVPPKVSDVISYGVPIAEVGLGFKGLKGQVVAAKFAKQTPSTIITGTSQEVGGVNQIRFLSETTIGGKKAYTLGEGFIKQDPTGKIYFSGTRGYTVKGDVGVGVRVNPLEWNSRFARFEPVIEDVSKFYSFSRGQKLGKGFVSRKLSPQERLRAELGEGVIIDKKGIIFNQEGNVQSFVGGDASLRVSTQEGRASLMVRDPNIQGKFLRLEPKVSDTEVKILQGGGTKKTPFSTTFQEEQKLVSSLAVDAQKQAKNILTPPKKPVGGIGGAVSTLEAPEIRARSQYWGTGQYERTEDLGSVGVAPNVRDVGVVIPKPSSLTRTFTPSVQRTRVITRGEAREKDFTGILPRDIGKVQPKEIIKSLQAPRLRMRQRTKQIQRQRPQIPQPVPPKPRTPRKPPKRVPLPKVPFLKSKKTKPILKKGDETLYIAEVKKGGKFIELGRFQTKETAVKKGEARLKGTLAATLRVRKGKEILGIGKETPEFRPSKVDPRLLVQRKTKRIKTRGEITDILGSRRRIRTI